MKHKVIHNVQEKVEISSYYSHLRRSVLDHIPKGAKCVLSVGCAQGVTESEIVKRGIKVVGVEINSEAARIARQRGLITIAD